MPNYKVTYIAKCVEVVRAKNELEAIEITGYNCSNSGDYEFDDCKVEETTLPLTITGD